MIHWRHKWITYSSLRDTDSKSIPIKRKCEDCGKKQINVWGFWLTVRGLRSLELYEIL